MHTNGRGQDVIGHRPREASLDADLESNRRTAGVIEVQLFGGPCVSIDGDPIAVTLLQQRFLTLVFLHGDPGISRPRLGWLLWEQDEGPKLRLRVRQLLHRTNKRLGAAVVLAEGDRLHPNRSAVDSDLTRFDSWLRGGTLAGAAGLLSKGLASRLCSSCDREFQDWLAAKEKRLADDLRSVAARRWDETSEAGLWGEARDAAEALYIHAPNDVSVATRLIEARARTGSLASAETVYTSLKRSGAQAEELAEVGVLIRRLGRLRQAQPASATAREPQTPLLGRDQEIAKARAILDDVHGGTFPFLLITGEGGIGKTRLLEEIQREAVLAGLRCLCARPTEPERRIPLNPLADALLEVDVAGHLRALGNPWRSVVAALLPVEDSKPIEEVPPIQEAHLSRRLMDALFMLMERVAQEEPTILLLDDLQWADATTITALQFIQRRWEGGPLGVVAALRPDAVDTSEPTARYLRDQEHLPVSRIDLGELPEREGRRLVTFILGNPVDPVVNERICDLGGLHPLYIIELARDYRSGRLRLPELPVDEVAIPVPLQEIFRRRLELLSATSSRVAGILAVRARAMRLTEVAELTGLPLDQCADCADELKELRLVELSGDTVRIAHELFRSALYHHLSEARRAVLHRSIAGHLAQAREGRPDGELAIHFARAGETGPAVAHGWMAARQAVDCGAVAEAAYFFELVRQHEVEPGRRAVATAELGRALHLGREIERANPLLAQAARLLRESGDPNRALRMDIRRVEGLAETVAAAPTSLLERLHGIKDQARCLEDWEALALALDLEMHVRHALGDLPAISRLFSEMRHVVTNGGRRAGSVAHSGLALQVLFGDHLSALTHGRLGVQTCDPCDEHRLRALLRLLLVLQYQGAFYRTEAQGIITEASLLAKTSGDLLLRFSLESNIAVAHLDSGNLDAAEVAMGRSTAMLGRAELDVNRFNQAINAGELALAQGEYECARLFFLRAQGFVGPKTPAYSESMVRSGLGICALKIGDLRTAKAMEADLPSDPSWWYFDPTLLVTFRCSMLVARNRLDEADSLLCHTTSALAGRLVLAWLKLKLLHARIHQRADPGRAMALAQEGLDLAEDLGLENRGREFSTILCQARIDARL